MDLRDFVSEPVGDKYLTLIPGMSLEHSKILNGAGFTHASQLVGKFLLLQKDKEAFGNWLQSILNFDEGDDLDCVCEAVSKYTDAFVGQ